MPPHEAAYIWDENLNIRLQNVDPNWFILELPGEFELWRFNAARATLATIFAALPPPSLPPSPPLSVFVCVSSHLLPSVVRESISVDRHTRQLQRLYRAAVHTLNIRFNL